MFCRRLVGISLTVNGSQETRDPYLDLQSTRHDGLYTLKFRLMAIISGTLEVQVVSGSSKGSRLSESQVVASSCGPLSKLLKRELYGGTQGL